jgi:hypothetical protein
MKSQANNETVIIRYLLGDLPEEEAQRFERSFLQDEGLFQQLDELEEELIDDYVTGALSADKHGAFEKYFLQSPERRDKVQFARAMTEHAGLWKKTRDTEVFDSAMIADDGFGKTPAVTPEKERDLPKRWLRPVPAWREWTAIAAAFLFAVTGLALWLKGTRLQRELAATRQEQAQLRQSEAQARSDSAQLKGELSAEQKQSQALEEKISNVDRLASLDPASRVVYAVRIGIEYLSNDSKGEGALKPKTLKVPAKAELVRLGVEFEKNDFQVFKATLRRTDRSIVWTRGGLKPRAAGNNQSVTLAIPGEILVPGEYVLVVSGVTPEGNSESVGRYAIKVERN